MSIREVLNRNPAITALLAVILIGAALYIVYVTNKEPAMPKMQTKSFYSIDDGRTYFEEKMGMRAPFMRDGKEAVKVHLFTCDGGNTQFVGYLEKYSDDFISKYSAPATQTAGGGGFGPAPGTGPEEVFARMVKKPGEGEWRKWASMEGQEVVKLTCPDGNPESVREVLPKEE